MRILVVDDHPMFREVIALHLNELYPDSMVFEAGSMQEALGVVRQYRNFDLIMLDVSMPGENGITGIDSLRRESPDSPIVMVSGIGDEAIAHVAVEQGANGYITKSAEVREFKNALGLVLAGETPTSLRLY